MSNSVKVFFSIVLVIVVALGGFFVYQHYQTAEEVNNHLSEENQENKENNHQQEENKEEEHKISKYAQMYLTLFDDIMSVDTAINDGDFLSIDIASLDKEYANEELKETTRVFYIDETDVKDIVEYMKKYNDVIKTNSLDELEEEGLFNREKLYVDGPVIYVSNIEIVREDHFKISMVKYRGGLAAIFHEYEVKYEDGKWEFEILSSAIA